MLVGGEAGVGKTALLRRFCETREAPRVLWGACEPLRTPRPLGPFVDIGEATGGELEELVRRRRPAARGRGRAARASCAARAPTVLVLEDVHWADEATLDVLRCSAARHRLRARARARELPRRRARRAEPLRIVLGELARPARPAQARAALAGGRRRARGAARRGRRASCTARPAATRSSSPRSLAAGGERMPDTVRDAVLARAARLSEPRAPAARRGRRRPPDRSSSGCWRRSPAELVDRARRVPRVGMLVAAGRAHVAFRHELARMAIEEALAAGPAARAAPRGAGGARGTRGATPTWRGSRTTPRRPATPTPCCAGRRAPPSARRRPARTARRPSSTPAPCASPTSCRSRRAPSCCERRAYECYTTAAFAAAIAAQREALDCCRRLGDRVARATRCAPCHGCCSSPTGLSEAEPLAREAVERLERLPAGHELAMAYANVAQRRMVVEDVEEAARWGAQALELAERLDDRRRSSTRSRTSARPSSRRTAPEGASRSSERSTSRSATASRRTRGGRSSRSCAARCGTAVRRSPTSTSTLDSSTAPSAASTPGGSICSRPGRAWRSLAAASTRRPTRRRPSCTTLAARPSRGAGARRARPRASAPRRRGLVAAARGGARARARDRRR